MAFLDTPIEISYLEKAVIVLVAIAVGPSMFPRALSPINMFNPSQPNN